MALVKNWQIGREMSYWYAESRPKRQFGAVFDINKCIACQTCTLACKTTWTSGKGQEYMLWNNVETKPYGFYPMAWDINALNLLGAEKWSGGAYEGRTLFEAARAGERVLGYTPDALDYAHPNLGEDETYGTTDKGAFLQGVHNQMWMFYLARICNHCTYPACLASCPRGSIYKRPEDGIVLLDQSRCRGYQECVKACPYKKVFFNPVSGTSEKCIACFPKIEMGEQPQCFTNCIGKIRLQGWISTPDKVREDNPIDYLVHVRKIACPLFPQFGLEPNVYYVPPIHVPDRYLRMMFGPNAPAAAAEYRKAKDDPILPALFRLFGSTPMTVARFEVAGDFVSGFDDTGKLLVRVPILEPKVERPLFDKKLSIYRHNTP